MKKRILPLLTLVRIVLLIAAFFLINTACTNKPATPSSVLAAPAAITPTSPTNTTVPSTLPELEQAGTATSLPPHMVETAPANPPTTTPTFAASALPVNTAAAVTAAPNPAPNNAIVINHHSVALFEQIPDEYITAAAATNMLFIDRSVGANIDNALDCLSFPNAEAAPNNCARHQHVNPTFSVNPSLVQWNRPGGYDRHNWDFQFWPEAAGCDRWQDKVRCFMEMVDPVIGQYEVVSFQFSYLEVTEDSTIDDPSTGFFADNPNEFDVFDLETYESQHPDKTFIYWTTSLSRGIGSETSDTFNDQVRQYALANQKVLFDVADILVHDPAGNPCYDNRDGIPYDNGNNSENYPDDGFNFLAICPHYTTETDGGHLGSVSAGKIQIAKAFWVLMAYLAGWDGTPEP